MLVAYAIFEIGSTAYDIYDAGRTLADPDASTGDKALSVGGAILGVWTPGPGSLYTKGAQRAVRLAEELAGIRAKLRNIRRELESFNHFRTARLERTGRLVTGANHVKELTDFSNGLRNAIERLKQMLADPTLTDEMRAEIIKALRELSILRDQIQRAVR